ncbi:MAG: F0F1 ATP synthase subunit B [Bacteroidales bacterium]|jgi:F-type H+-transporting ATPase subunit b|nr:F0F1 ATP synthase subunit B [Bacteroidales bacterium]
MQLVTPDIGLLFWMLVSFLIVFFLLKKFAWKPILNMLHEREDSIDQALKAADKAKEDMKKLQADNERILDEARAEREKIFREAQEIKEKIVGEAREQANKEKDKIMNETRASIEAEKNVAIREIRDIAAELSIQVAEKLLRNELSNDQKQKELIEKFIEDIPVN